MATQKRHPNQKCFNVPGKFHSVSTEEYDREVSFGSCPIICSQEKRFVVAAKNDFGYNRNKISLLFYKVHELIVEIRLVTQETKRTSDLP